MSHSTPTDQELAELRKQIDQLDQNLVSLLKERMHIVHQVGHLKKKQNNGSFIRPAREATMVRQLVDQLQSDYPASAIGRIWRTIIASSLHSEKPLNIAVSDEHSAHCYWLAREYFGDFIPVTHCATTTATLDFVEQDPSHIAVLEATGHWWHSLPKIHPHTRVFACIPFVISTSTIPQAYALSQTTSESTGDDLSLLHIEAHSPLNRTSLQKTLEAQHIKLLDLQIHDRLGLAQVEGFYPPQACKTLSKALSANVSSIGCYARPIEVK